ncbi:cytochrome P450 [Aspergillus arachidicola]|uniref:Cytochrome P450 n=1 Tax=Aspergillus arachidicola TaxID=656916 RepID=A0A2G7FJ42_9EURO|nr:cytochrome P450 [Aspergillus arachidicola]
MRPNYACTPTKPFYNMDSILRYVFLLLAMTSFYMMYISLLNNGFFNLLSHQLATRALPGESDITLLSEYTGLKALDGILESTVIFFWPICQGHHVGLSLMGLSFSGGMVGIWMIVVAHICRTRSFMRGMVITLIVGIAQQAVGPGIVIPCYFALTSRARLANKNLRLTGTYSTSNHGLVVSMTMSYIFPLVIISLPAPAMISLHFKQQAIAAWQGWPVYFVVIMTIHHLFISRGRRKEALARRQVLSVYHFCFACSCLCHMAWLSVFVTSKIQSLTQSRNLWYLCPYGVTFPLLNQPAQGLGALEAGLFTFLQWDYGVAVAATMVWSTDRYIQECHRPGLEIDKVRLIRRLLGWILIDGPSATAVRLVWESEGSSYLQNPNQGVKTKVNYSSEAENGSMLLVVTLVILFIWFIIPNPVKRSNVSVPTVTLFNPYLPEFLSRVWFNSTAPTVIYKGYRQYKDRAFRLLKPDGDIIVLSNKYVEELRQLPLTTLNALEAVFEDHVGTYTTILNDSHLHTEVIQKRLTPAISRLIPRIIDELDHGFDVEMPECEDKWVLIRPYEVFLRLVARAGARVFVGPEICRTEKWLTASIDFTKNIFMTITLLRPIPSFLHPIIGPMLPSSRSLDTQLRYVQDELLGPEIVKRRQRQASRDPDYEKPDDFLQWMIDLTQNDKEGDPSNIAHRLLGLTSMAVVHTSAMSITHGLYDLITMPQWLEPLREEIQEVMPNWKSTSYSSLRFNPPGELSFHRVVKKDLVLSDGLRLPKGTHICMASGPIGMDTKYISDPDAFDALRYVDGDKAQSQFVHTSATSMHFGLGRYACPGRFFATFVLKAILSRFLVEYEFRFGPDQVGRPKNMLLGDKIVPNTSVDVYVRKRTGSRKTA